MATPATNIVQAFPDEESTELSSTSHNSEHPRDSHNSGDDIPERNNISIKNTTVVGLNPNLIIPPQQSSQSLLQQAIYKCREIVCELLEAFNNFLVAGLRFFLFLLSILRFRRIVAHTVIIPSSGPIFYLPTVLLTENSHFFTATLNPFRPFIESRTQTVRLPDVPYSAFYIYAIWVTTRQIPIDRVSSRSWFSVFLRQPRNLVYLGDKTGVTEQLVSMRKIEVLVEAYILGDYLQAPFGYLDLVMSHLIDSLGEIFIADQSQNKIPLGSMLSIWEQTYPKTPLREVIIDMLISCMSQESMSEALELCLLSEDMLTEVDEKLEQLRDGIGSKENNQVGYPWKTYSERYFMYARHNQMLKDGKLNAGTGPVPAYWDSQGSELQLPKDEEW